MKKKILYFMFLCILCMYTQVTNITGEEETKEDSELTIEVESIENESYEGITGNYKHFNFFSSTVIEKADYQEHQIHNGYAERQNTILKSKEVDEEDTYVEIQNTLLQEPIGALPVTITKEDTGMGPYIVMIGIMAAIVLVGTYIYYQRRMERRLLEYDESNSIYSE